MRKRTDKMTTVSADPLIGVIGAGSWGTALAQLLAGKGLSVDLWALEPEVHDQIRDFRENKVFLPGAPLSENIRPCTDLLEVVDAKDILLMVVPSEWFRETALKMAPLVREDAIVATATKGIEVGTRLTMAGILEDTLPHLPEGRICALSGPSFAIEVAKGVPTAVTAGARDEEVAKTIQHIFATPVFRVYTSTDILGVELGGAVKNVMAIAAGICDGLKLGANTRAALITRGLAEIRRLGVALGADPDTFSGLSGVGDLVLTCTTDLSRNHTVGKKLGQGKKLADILAEMRMVAEGVRNAKSVYNLSINAGVEMPIVGQTYRILYEDLDPGEALIALMTRKLKAELDDA